MTQNTPDGSLADRVRFLEAQLQNLQRPRSGAQPNLRDLRDCNPLTKVANGQVPVYSSATGKWAPGTPGTTSTPPFSLPGVPYVSTSGRWYPESTRTITRLFASLAVAGTTATTAAFYRNGVSVATVTIAIGALTGVTTLSSAFTGPETDYMQVGVTAAGAGASDLTVQPS